jgi:glycosyltransferase involved in cell wall biosynthesis
MRVLHVIPGMAARTGGVASALVELCLGLEEGGVETAIFSTDLPATATARANGTVRAEELPPGAYRLDVRLYAARPPRRLAFSPTLADAVKREAPRFDVVHVHSLWLHPTFAAWRAAVQASMPYVVCPQGMLDPALRPRGRTRKALTMLAWQRRMLNGATALHFTADDEARLAAHIAPHVPRSVIPNPIDWSSYRDLDGGRAFRERFLDGHQGPLVLNHGRVARKKGIDVLIEAFALVARDLPDARLAIVGPDDEGLVPELTALAARLGVANRTVFTGMLGGGDRAGALAAADVWALPSRQDAWASAVTEALAAGLPTVVSPGVNSARDIVAANAGLVCERTAEAFAEGIGGLLRDDEARADLGARAAHFAQRYDRAQVAAEAANLYEAAVARRTVTLTGRLQLDG